MPLLKTLSPQASRLSPAMPLTNWLGHCPGVNVYFNLQPFAFCTKWRTGASLEALPSGESAVFWAPPEWAVVQQQLSLFPPMFPGPERLPAAIGEGLVPQSWRTCGFVPLAYAAVHVLSEPADA